MRRLHLNFVVGLYCLFAFTAVSVPPLLAQNPTTVPAASSYEALIAEGRVLLKADKLKDAYGDALAAAKQDSKRFEAFALAAFILDRQASYDKAKEILADAIVRAPEDKRDVLLKFQKQIDAERAKIGTVPSNSDIAQKDHDYTAVMESLRDFNRQIQNALKDYLPTSEYVNKLKSEQAILVSQNTSRILQLYDEKVADLNLMLKEMRPDSAVVVAIRGDIIILESAAKPQLINRLWASSKANDNPERGQMAILSLHEILRLDPSNDIAETMLRHVLDYYPQTIYVTASNSDNFAIALSNARPANKYRLADTVVIRSGTYIISYSPTITDGVTITADRKGLTTIVLGPDLVTVRPKAKLIGLNIQMEETSYFFLEKNAVISNCNIIGKVDQRGNPRSSIAAIYETDGALVERSTISKFGTGICVQAGGQINHCIIQHCSSYGVEAEGKASLTANTFSSCDVGLRIYKPAEGSDIENNMYMGNRIGIVSNVRTIVLRSNIFDKNELGITAVDGLSLEGNKFTGNGKDTSFSPASENSAHQESN